MEIQDESKTGGGTCSSDRYLKHLAGFYSNAVGCTMSPVDQVQSLAGEMVICLFSLVTISCTPIPFWKQVYSIFE